MKYFESTFDIVWWIFREQHFSIFDHRQRSPTSFRDKLRANNCERRERESRRAVIHAGSRSSSYNEGWTGTQCLIATFHPSCSSLPRFRLARLSSYNATVFLAKDTHLPRMGWKSICLWFESITAVPFAIIIALKLDATAISYLTLAFVPLGVSHQINYTRLFSAFFFTSEDWTDISMINLPDVIENEIGELKDYRYIWSLVPEIIKCDTR